MATASISSHARSAGEGDHAQHGGGGQSRANGRKTEPNPPLSRLHPELQLRQARV